MVHFLQVYGYRLVFLSVFLENLGLPFPSYPVVLIAAAIATISHFSLLGIVLVSTVAALVGDGAWYLLGRVRGRSILKTLCSISLNPDSCVSRTENLFARHGLKSLLVAKFLPGLNTVAPPMAGMLKLSPWQFIVFDLVGAVLWAGSGVFLGLAFRSQLEWLLAWLAALGRIGALVLAVLLGGWILLKWIERRRFYRLLERSRITAAEVKEMLGRGEVVVVVDLRSEFGYNADGLKIPGSLHIPPSEFDARYKEVPQDRPVVMVCT